MLTAYIVKTILNQKGIQHFDYSLRSYTNSSFDQTNPLNNQYNYSASMTEDAT